MKQKTDVALDVIADAVEKMLTKLTMHSAKARVMKMASLKGEDGRLLHPDVPDMKDYKSNPEDKLAIAKVPTLTLTLTHRAYSHVTTTQTTLERAN